MFKIDPNPTFETRVSGFVPGRPSDGLFVTFNYKDSDAFQLWLASFADKTVEDLVMDIVHSWRDAPREFSREALQEIAKKYQAFVPALINTYRRELLEAREKN